MRPELASLLYSKYPHLFLARIGIHCGDGWFNLLDVLCEQLQQSKGTNEEFQVTISDVKEKYGGLRFYVNGATDSQFAMIDLAEALSERICEKCGAPGSLFENAGWCKTRCSSCMASE